MSYDTPSLQVFYPSPPVWLNSLCLLIKGNTSSYWPTDFFKAEVIAATKCPGVWNKYFMRCYINQHNLLTSDKCLEKLFILRNSAEYHPAGREEALKTCNELHTHVSTLREKPLSHGDCKAIFIFVSLWRA